MTRAPHAEAPFSPPGNPRWAHVFIALASCLLVLLLEILRPMSLQRFDEGLRDFFLRATANASPEERVLIVDINDESLRQLGAWPWPRARVADLVEILLTDYGARAVGLDIVFPETSEDVAGDARLTMLARYAPLTLAQAFDFTPRVPRLAQGALAKPSVSIKNAPAPEAFGYIANHGELGQAARCAGNIGYVPDLDGILRHTPLYTAYQGKIYPQFALALIQCAPRDAAPQKLPDLPPKQQWRIPFRHASDAYVVIPAAEILDLTAPRPLIEGRYVIIGSSSFSLGDRVSTPLNPLLPGVFVHAQSVSALLDQADSDHVFSRYGRVFMIAYALLSLLLAVRWIARLTAWGSVLLLAGFTLAWAGLAFPGIAWQLEYSIIAPLSGYLLLLSTLVPYEWRQAQRQNRRVLETLAHYVARPVLDELARQNQIYSLAPTLREITVLVADMEGYTHMTSVLGLEDAARLTKDFLDCLTRPVLASEGTLDKYNGDGLVAFWGAPLTSPDQADKAVEAALNILREVELFNQSPPFSGCPGVRVRIGIESGFALVGDLGTPFRSTYTAVGDCINFASRLESVAKDMSASLIIGPTANSKIQRHATCSLGCVTLRGMETAIHIYTVTRPESDR
jgi:adenylate cyclase